MYPSGMDVDYGTIAYEVASQNKDKLKALELRVEVLESQVAQLFRAVRSQQVSHGNG